MGDRGGALDGAAPVGEQLVDQDAPTAGTPITGTGVFVQVEPVSGSEQRVASFTVVCAE